WPWYVAGWSALAALRLAVARRFDLPLELGDPSAIVRVLVASLGNLALPIDVAPLNATADLRVAPGIAAAIGLAWAFGYLPGVRRRVFALGLVVFAVFALPAVGLAIAFAEIGQAAIRETRTRIAVAVATVAGLAAVSAGYE